MQVNEVIGCRPKAWALKAKAKAKAWTFKAKAKDLQIVLKESLRPRTKAKDNNTVHYNIHLNVISK